MKIGITGPIASGKTSVSQILSEIAHAQIIDADAVGREVAEADPQLCDRIASALGNPAVKEEKGLNRRLTAQIVFNDPSKLVLLNQLIHPPMIEEISRRMQLAFRELVVVDAAVLLDWELAHALDGIVLVTAGEEIRLERLMQKGFSRDDALSRIKSQGPWDKRKSQCRWEIENNGSDQELRSRVDAWWNQVKN
jgi:dephospho-CoA kinase